MFHSICKFIGLKFLPVNWFVVGTIIISFMLRHTIFRCRSAQTSSIICLVLTIISATIGMPVKFGWTKDNSSWESQQKCIRQMSSVRCTYLVVDCNFDWLRFVCGLCCICCNAFAWSKYVWYFTSSDLYCSSLCSDSFNWPSTVIGSPNNEFPSYTTFIFIKPSRAAFSDWIFCWISWILAVNFLRRWFGGKSLQSSLPLSVCEFYSLSRQNGLVIIRYEIKFRR